MPGVGQQCLAYHRTLSTKKPSDGNGLLLLEHELGGMEWLVLLYEVCSLLEA